MEKFWYHLAPNPTGGRLTQICKHPQICIQRTTWCDFFLLVVLHFQFFGFLQLYVFSSARRVECAILEPFSSIQPPSTTKTRSKNCDFPENLAFGAQNSQFLSTYYLFQCKNKGINLTTYTNEPSICFYDKPRQFNITVVVS